MAEPVTIARPYAQALYRLARERDALGPWQERLDLLAAIAMHPEVDRRVRDPRLTREQSAALFLDIAGEHLDAAGRNLVRLLAENRRLPLLPAIRDLYARLRHEAEGAVDVELVAAREVPEALVERITAALSQRLQRRVDVSVRTDPGLLGGAVIRAGDLVIDGSVRGRLQRLAQALGQ
ncbi:MAG: F0F1 ATP synthase subunit delta [Gammaproteobacteria bacterium]|nr:MAG: F0F1 ATP synthase subunit delta [Gammaproteobacteria bacterium]